MRRSNPGGCEAAELGRWPVGRRNLVPELESENLLVKLLRPFEVAHDLTRVVVDSHPLPPSRMLRREDFGQVKGHGRAVVGRLSYLLFATGDFPADDGHIVVVQVEDAGGPEQEVTQNPCRRPGRSHPHRVGRSGSSPSFLEHRVKANTPSVVDSEQKWHRRPPKQTQVCRTERRPGSSSLLVLAAIAQLKMGTTWN